MRHLNILIAGGGTGGHLFPGIAIAEAFLEKDPKTKILFVGTGKAMENDVLSKNGFDHKHITAGGIKRETIWNQLISILKIPKGIIESLRIIQRFKPNIVIGVGGYSSGPVVLAAWILGIKSVIQEQNIVPGITNRLLAHLADRVFISFESTHIKINPKKIRITGNPVRKEFRNFVIERNSDYFTVLIIGGSQGAHAVNMAVIDAISYLTPKRIGGEGRRFYFIHQTGIKDEGYIKKAYEQAGISCTVKAFFHDVPRQYQKADLVICRAGATTVAEITAMGKAAIFIPYPYAADGHQILNARMLEDVGAAEMILQQNLTGKIIAQRIEYYASHPEAFVLLENRSRRFGKPDAADAIVKECYRIVP